MSKLASLRGGNSAPQNLFSSTIDSSVSNVFARLQGQKNTPFKDAKPKFVPSRFRVEKNTTKRMVVIDDKFSFGMQEHSLQGPDGYWTTERCISAWDTCPLCNKDNVNTYDIILLTVLDLTPWTTKDGKEIEYTKRVLGVKKNDIAAFSGLMGVHGSLRGLVLDMTRGDGAKESAAGKPTFVSKLSDEELIETFGHEAKISEKGTVIVAENDSVVPWNYEKFFPVPTKTDLTRKYNIAPRPGSFEEESDENIDQLVLNVLDLTEQLPEVD